MPTARPRYQVTETPAVQSALDAAQEHWPDEPRSRLLVRLVELGAGSLRDETSSKHRRRQAALRAVSGSLPDAYPPGYLDDLRDDWPE